MHAPWTWQIVGLAISSSRFHVSRIGRRNSAAAWVGGQRREAAEVHAAENIAPAPRTTTQSTSRSAAAAAAASRIARISRR
jgi:hypothetical protein